MKLNQNQSVGLPGYYFASVNVAAVLIIVLLIAFGFNGWGIVISVLVGAALQTAFRITKRVWKNTIQSKGEMTASQEISNLKAIKVYVSIYIVMMFVAALWYGVGVLVRKLL